MFNGEIDVSERTNHVMMSGLEDGDMKKPENFYFFMKKLGYDIHAKQLINMNPKIGSIIRVDLSDQIVCADNPVSVLANGVFTQTPGMFLKTIVSDELVVIFKAFDRVNLVGLGMARIGLMEASEHFSRKMLQRMLEYFHNISVVEIAFSPYIGKCCNRFNAEDFRTNPLPRLVSLEETDDGFVSIDLLKEVIYQMTIDENSHLVHIPLEQRTQVCTCCSKDIRGNFKFPSYRRNLSKGEAFSQRVVLAGMI